MGSALLKLLVKEKDKDYGKNRSFVRRLGSILPLKPSHRVNLPDDRAQALDGAGDFIYGSLGDGQPERFTPQVQRTLNYEEFVVIVKRMNEMEGLMYKMLDHMHHLEETLDTLILNVSHAQKLQAIEEQVNKILINLTTKDLSSVNKKMLQEYTSVDVRPPSPPPLPPTPANFYTPPSQIIRQNKSEQKNPRRGMLQDKARLSLSEVLKDIGNVKLRPVARSPGGNPVRQQPISNHPSSILTNAIKKKFAALHHEPTPEKETKESDFTLNTE